METRPGRGKFSEIKPLVPAHARQSQVTKIGRKTTSALEPQTTLIIIEQNLWILLKTTAKA